MGKLAEKWERLEEFLAERHDLHPNTKTHYRMAFQALTTYTYKPFMLNHHEMTEALNLLAGDYAPSSWNGYVLCVRAVYRWMGRGAVFRNIRFKKIRREDYVKTKLLSEAEVKALLRACDNPRDRAVLAVAAGTGARRGELLNLCIRDVAVRPYGYDLVLTGKTGTHPSPPLVKDFAKILRVWLEHHPMRGNPDAPLWVRLRSGHWGGKLERVRRSTLHDIVKKAARAAGFKRNVHLHMFRHTENTLETKMRVPAAARKKLHGWSPTSNTPSLYEHLTDEDSVEAALRGHGIVNPSEEAAAGGFEPVECGYCGESNPSEYKYCHFCGTPLDAVEAEGLVVGHRLVELLSDPEVAPKFERWLRRLAKEKADAPE